MWRRPSSRARGVRAPGPARIPHRIRPPAHCPSPRAYAAVEPAAAHSRQTARICAPPRRCPSPALAPVPPSTSTACAFSWALITALALVLGCGACEQRVQQTGARRSAACTRPTAEAPGAGTPPLTAGQSAPSGDTSHSSCRSISQSVSRPPGLGRGQQRQRAGAERPSRLVQRGRGPGTGGHADNTQQAIKQVSKVMCWLHLAAAAAVLALSLINAFHR